MKFQKRSKKPAVKRTVPLLFLILFAGLLSGKLVWSTCPDDRAGARPALPTPEAAEETPVAPHGRAASETVQATTTPTATAPAAPAAPTPAAPAPRAPARR